MTMKMERGVAYCVNTDCLNFAQAAFWLVPAGRKDLPACPDCFKSRKVVLESTIPQPAARAYCRVEVHFDFQVVSTPGCLDEGFRQIATVCDASMNPALGTFVFKSPTIRTEKRAIHIATCLLANLQTRRAEVESGVVKPFEMRVMNLDSSAEDFSQQLEEIFAEVEGSSLVDHSLTRNDLVEGDLPGTDLSQFYTGISL